MTSRPSRMRSWPSSLLVGLFVAAVGGSWWGIAKPHAADSSWPGVDESVIERFAAASEVVRPGFSIDWLRGDLLLFAFLWAGLLSGTALGYFAHALFVCRSREPGPMPAGAGPSSHAEPR